MAWGSSHQFRLLKMTGKLQVFIDDNFDDRSRRYSRSLGFRGVGV